MEKMEIKSSEDTDEDQETPEQASKSVQTLDVKSTAVVKYIKMLPIENYSTLELNTDINEPPHNWLHDSLQGRFSNWTSAKHEPVELSSLNMAHNFPENIDEVDVISDAENIKKLLKMPFSKTGISMSVNKIGRTLLLDQFDVQNLLSQAAQNKNLTKLTWLQDVFSEEANIEKDKTALRKKKDPSQSRERNMMSKFLCYSSPEDSVAGEPQYPSSIEDDSLTVVDESLKNPTQVKEPSSSCKALVPFLPEPIPKPHERTSFQRNVLWKFEDTKMLIGSNMPIFGGGKYPAVSLRLNDCSKPINVLTGLDYWLDNLMCNVPEVVMCFHLDGIVQKYEHYKTDELPDIEGRQFSPRVIKDVARNILSFLKSNCTLEGHTYWLFKGNGSDVVKLYDLTSLCDKTPHGESTNPFSVPVAMLLYRVAKNMINQSKIAPRERDMIQVLLSNCVHLLNNEPDPDDHLEIITSAHYLLAELYCLGKETGGDELLQNVSHGSEDDGDCEEDEEFPWPKTLTIGDLSKSNSFEESYEEVSVQLPGDANDKLRLSLSHVVKALKNLRGASCDRKFSSPSDESKRNNLLPSRPYLLALPDAEFSEKTGDDFVSRPVEGEAVGESSPLNFDFRQWQGTFESVLIRKAAGLYSDLSSLAQAQGAHGLALRYSRLSLGCLSSYRTMEWVNASQELDLLPTVLCGIGDAYLAIARSRDLEKCLEECENDYQHFAEDDQYFDQNFGSTEDPVYQLNVVFIPDVEKLLLKSMNLYEKALDNSTDEKQIELLVKLTKRLGNVRNELGLFYLNTAVEKSSGAGEVENEVQKLWKKSLDSFSGAIRAFQALDDRTNVALLYSNCGRLMRTCCQSFFNGPDDRGMFDNQEKAYYTNAIEFYQQSLRALRERKSFPGIWDRVSWELSSTYFTMGSLIQEFTSLKDKEPEQCEREVSDLMFKALKLCEALEFSSQQSNNNVKNRIGMIHYRLGTLYHHSYRVLSTNDQNAKKKKRLAEFHYSKAADHIDASQFPCEWLRTSLERVALLEHHLSSARLKGPGAIKILETILELLLNSHEAFIAMSPRKEEKYPNEDEKTDPSDRTKFICSNNAHGGTCAGENGATKKTEGNSLAHANILSGGLQDSPSDEGEIDFIAYEEHTELTSETKEAEKIREFSSLVNIFEFSLKSCLKEFVKIHSSTKSSSGSQKLKENVFKRMFEVTLRANLSSTSDLDVAQQSEKIISALDTLEELRNNKE